MNKSFSAVCAYIAIPTLALVLLSACRDQASAKPSASAASKWPGEPTLEAVCGTDKENALKFPVWFGEVPGKPGVFLALERGGARGDGLRPRADEGRREGGGRGKDKDRRKDRGGRNDRGGRDDRGGRSDRGGDQDARIYVFEEKDGKWSREVFLTLPVRSSAAASDERGLLGIAFHPAFPENRRYFLYYMPKYDKAGTDSTVIEERRADTSLTADDGGRGRQILAISQPYANHNGGTLAFGPRDGKLYIGTGDGGAGGDPHGHAQNLGSLLGKMLRIDVDDTVGGRPYGIPADNPFASGRGPEARDGSGAAARPEIWAFGLRNPWKWSFDAGTGDLWAGDVGQNNREEITKVGRGWNLGWKIMEGFACFDPTEGCSREGLTLPLVDLPRDEARSITGGYVYRADAKSPYYGAYFFGDWETRNWWVLPADFKAGDAPRKLKPLPDQPASFGTDAGGNLYMIGYRKGIIYRLAF